MAIFMVLKAKYRQPGRKSANLKGAPHPEGGTWIYSRGLVIAAHPRTGNTHGPTPKWAKLTVKPRKRAYGPF